jgi:hypothetical protein
MFQVKDSRPQTVKVILYQSRSNTVEPLITDTAGEFKLYPL